MSTQTAIIPAQNSLSEAVFDDNDLLEHIFSNLSPQDLFLAARVNSEF